MQRRCVIGDGERGRLVDAHRDQSGRESRLGRADASGRRDHARENRRRGVDEDELSQVQVNPVREAGRSKRDRVGQLREDVSAEQLDSLVAIPGDAPDA